MRPTASSGIDRLSHHGKLHDECRALTGRAVDANLAGMFLDDTVGHRQSQPCATAVSRLRFVLGGEERIVDAMDMLLRNSCTRIRYLHLYVMAIGGADHQRAACGHCVFGIQEQIEKNLLQLSRVPVNRRQFRLQLGLHLDARGLELMIEQGQRVLYDAIQVHIAEFGARGTREVQQAVNDFRSAEGLARDLVQQAGLLLVAVDLLGQHLRIGRDNSQRSVDLVRDSGCEQAYGGELLRLRELRFQLDPLGNIVHDDQAANDAEVFRDQRSDSDIGYTGVTGGRAQPELVQVAVSYTHLT